MIPVGEGVGMLDLIRHIKKGIKEVESSEIITYSDNKFRIKKYHQEAKKASNCAREAGRR